jgi:hypothetical protein
MEPLLSLLLLASAQVAAEPMPSEIHSFKDWVVTCDNGLRCEAVSLVPEPAPAETGTAGTAPPAAEAQDPWARFGVMRLVREAGPDAPLVLTITDFEGTPARLRQYDNDFAARISSAGEGSWRVEPADPLGFVHGLSFGTLQILDASGRELSEIALEGMNEALVYMEERQGRLRTPSAVVRNGRRPNSAVPAAPPRPVVQAAPRTSERALTIPAARLAEARRTFGCTLEEVGASGTDQSVHALGNGRSLLLMGCGAGAYNVSSLALLAWREGNSIRIEPARFDVARDPMEGQPDPKGFFVTNAEFDTATMSINEWAKGRGLGDCGTASRYVWDGDRFRLVEERAMSECRGTLELLQTWRADVR